MTPAQKYRQEQVEKIEKSTANTIRVITEHFDALYALAEELQNAKKETNESIRINTPFGNFVFNPKLLL